VNRSLSDVDPRLRWLLARAGEEWGPTTVARVANRLAETAGHALYVNHDRVKPFPGDVARDETTGNVVVWEDNSAARYGPFWWSPSLNKSIKDVHLPLTLLVDGDTGQVVP
jgi:hypothetical protein